jgi:ABC-type glycerol-3-phosphate transport system permease component
MSSEIDPDVTKYFRRIVRTLTAGLVWMVLQVLGGIMPGYAFVEDRFTWMNALYYLFFLLSLGVLLYYFYRLWGKKTP